MRRRDFLQTSAAAAAAVTAQAVVAKAAFKNVPVGIELYSVRGDLTKDLMATVRTVAAQGYKVVEFYAPYMQWTVDYARDVRKLMNDLGIECRSTHNPAESFGASMAKAIEINQVLGSKTIVLASPLGRPQSAADWGTMAATLTKAHTEFQKEGLRAGYHNHGFEWKAPEGTTQTPLQILAAGTPPSFTMQFDVGTCVATGADPVAWIKANPGRIRSVHCKDWGAGQGTDRGYRVLFGEGDSPWKAIFEAAEAVGGVEYYLIEQEGSRYSEIETAQRCIDTWKKLRA
jgi:sugar phosphate isomerase/epimerase